MPMVCLIFVQSLEKVRAGGTIILSWRILTALIHQLSAAPLSFSAEVCRLLKPTLPDAGMRASGSFLIRNICLGVLPAFQLRHLGVYSTILNLFRLQAPKLLSRVQGTNRVQCNLVKGVVSCLIWLNRQSGQ